eukprot:sb/3469236/
MIIARIETKLGWGGVEGPAFLGFCAGAKFFFFFLFLLFSSGRRCLPAPKYYNVYNSTMTYNWMIGYLFISLVHSYSPERILKTLLNIRTIGPAFLGFCAGAKFFFFFLFLLFSSGRRCLPAPKYYNVYNSTMTYNWMIGYLFISLVHSYSPERILKTLLNIRTIEPNIISTMPAFCALFLEKIGQKSFTDPQNYALSSDMRLYNACTTYCFRNSRALLKKIAKISIFDHYLKSIE